MLQVCHLLLFICCLMLFTLGSPFLIYGISLIRNYGGLFLDPLHLLNILPLNMIHINHVSKETHFLRCGFLFSVAHPLPPPCLHRSCALQVYWPLLLHLFCYFLFICPDFNILWVYKQSKLFPKVHNCVCHEVWHWNLVLLSKINIFCYIVCSLKEKI